MTTKIENISKGIIQYIDSYKKDLSKTMDEKDFKKYVRKLVKKNLKKFTDKENINKPKRCKSAFIFFCEDVRDQIKKDIPNIKVTDIIVEQSKRWRELNEKNSKKIEIYKKQAAKDKIRYEAEKIEYEKNKLNEENIEFKNKFESENQVESENEELKSLEKLETINSDEDSEDDIPLDKKHDKKINENKEDNSFYNFYNKKIKKIKKNNPDYTDDKIADKIKKKWKRLSEEEQASYA